MRTSGVVTAEEGRLGSSSLLAIGDTTAGLVVHMPGGAATYQRGARLEITGKLAAPYGQLEIRPAKADIHLLGTGSLPAPVTVPPAGLSEQIEGRLITTTGRLVVKPKKATGGDLSFVLERDGSSWVKVMADISSRIETLQVGAEHTRVTGVVGQRATRSGALDGYRLWVRDTADVVVVAVAAATPIASPGSGSPSPTTGAIATTSIARALKLATI